MLLSKAHKALADEKKSIESEMDTVRDEMANLESLNISIQSRLREKKELADQLERKVCMDSFDFLFAKSSTGSQTF